MPSIASDNDMALRNTGIYTFYQNTDIYMTHEENSIMTRFKICTLIKVLLVES
jgi:hypothetical protein